MANKSTAQPLLSADALQALLDAYDIEPNLSEVRPFGSGLINSTWKITFPHKADAYIFQRVNDKVFTRPELIAENIASIGQYLKQNAPDYLFIQPVLTRQGQGMLYQPDLGWFRLFPFVPNSHTVDTVADSRLAYEAAKQFGRFSRQLHHFAATQLHTTLPAFHNLSLRYRQFEAAVEAAEAHTRKQCEPEISQMLHYEALVQQYEILITDPNVPVRAIHHDTKISNCLFDSADNGLCVIDLDTVMPGYFISDVGDMCRTYLCPTGEESTNLEAVSIRMDYYSAMASGYLHEMGPVLTPAEMGYFVYAGKFMIYMQALRFLTDFLNGNTYYPVQHALHNLYRTRHQIALLQAYCHSEPAMQQVVTALVG
ncbi:MAG: aminoglycoside phosphotransferase family protein [Chitinophagaceae bacterium]|jgi:hypothetical protein|nr:aminoglycoside phosphotransferase family protein [Chitinophagaceae bacterium]